MEGGALSSSMMMSCIRGSSWEVVSSLPSRRFWKQLFYTSASSWGSLTSSFFLFLHVIVLGLNSHFIFLIDLQNFRLSLWLIRFSSSFRKSSRKAIFFLLRTFSPPSSALCIFLQRFSCNVFLTSTSMPCFLSLRLFYTRRRTIRFWYDILDLAQFHLRILR